MSSYPELSAAVRDFLMAKAEMEAARADWRDTDAQCWQKKMDEAERRMTLLAM